ncbi:MAG: glutathione S-transferase N-terminal domain-containing protein [Alcanivoracaceae bacterium]
MSLELFGSNASPYSCKLRAILRYRRIPHQWRRCMPAMAPEFAGLKLKLMPMLRDSNTGECRQESTALALQLEQEFDGRSVLPSAEADQFICHLIEDFADEWCTKLMFYYRWIDPRTAEESAGWIVDDTMPQTDPTARSNMIRMISERQRGRMALVGVGPDNGALLEKSMHALLAALKPLAESGLYLFGPRPSLADFGLYGQLLQLVTDSYPRQIIMQQAPALRHWLTALDDASGVEGEWQSDIAVCRDARTALLQQIGLIYLPFLHANAQALQEQREQLSLGVNDLPFHQAPFAWQHKCLQQLQARWAALSPVAKELLQQELADSNCLPWL